MKKQLMMFWAIVLSSLASQAQFDHSDDMEKWRLGVGFSFVNNTGGVLNDYFRFDKSWYTSVKSINADYIINKSFSLNGMFSQNTYKAGKPETVNTKPEIKMTSIDLNLRYSFKKLLPLDDWIEPYVYAGGAYIMADSSTIIKTGKNLFATTIGVGTYFWFNDRIGMNLQVCDKFSLGNPNIKSVFKQANAGIVIRFY